MKNFKRTLTCLLLSGIGVIHSPEPAKAALVPYNNNNQNTIPWYGENVNGLMKCIWSNKYNNTQINNKSKNKLLFTNSAASLLGSYKPLPAKIEAEAYDNMKGIGVENTGDTGGGQDVGWIEDNDWLDYNVNVPSNGSYTVKFRVANSYGSGKIELRDGSGKTLAQMDIPRTGGWQSWTTISTTATLSAGDQTLRIHAAKGLWNINWFEVSGGDNNSSSGDDYKSVPATIQAEAYSDMHGIGVENTADTGGGQDVGWIEDNDWLDYNVNVPSNGSYTVNLRVANSYGSGNIEIRNSSGAALAKIDVPRTGGWQSWKTITTKATLPAGKQTLRIYAVKGQWNFNWFEIAGSGSTTPTTPTSPVDSPVVVSPIDLIKAIISFLSLPEKTVGDAPFELSATSNNSETSITYTSSNTKVVSVSNSTGKWIATVVGAGTTTITASQSATSKYLAAASVSNTLTVKEAAPTTAGVKIPIEGSRWYQLNNCATGLDALFNGNTNEDMLNTGWGKMFDNYDAYYPLLDGESMTIESVKFYDGASSFADKPLTLAIIDDQWKRTTIATFKGTEFGTWVGPAGSTKQFKLDTPIKGARYLVLNCNWGFPTEIELYGSYTAGATLSGAPAKSPQIKGMLGVNAFEWDFEDPRNPIKIDEPRMNAAKSFRGVRHYLDWHWMEEAQGSFTYNPTRNGGWNYDAIYERCKAEGIEVLACLKTLPSWMLSTYPGDQRDEENVPVRYGKDFTDPKSYIEQAKIAFQYAARYGSNSNVDRGLLSVNSTPRWTNDPINTVKVGMGLIKYIECDNERDKWWKGRKAYQTGREYAANLSAFYDGHMNTMGAGVGVKNADPNMQVVMGGLAWAVNADYVKGMIDWCKQYRGYKDGKVNLCWDVINYHLYSDNSNSTQSGSSNNRGAAPEVSAAGRIANTFRQVAHQYAYDMPVWITETGYDFNQGSPLKAIAIGSKSVRETQADWILRTAMFYARAGIDRVFFYQMYDDNAASSIQFGSSGLINDDRSRRPASDYLYQFNKLFGEYYYKETLNSDPIVDRYELNGQSAYALVVPDEKGRTADYTLQLDNKIKTVRMYTPKIGSDDMDMQEVKTSGGKVRLTVTETPVFIIPGSSSDGRVVASAETKPEPFSSLQVYPNPAVDHVNIKLDNTDATNVEISIFDSGLGRLHKQAVFTKPADSVTGKVDLTSLPQGVYTVEVKQGNLKTFRKIVKVK